MNQGQTKRIYAHLKANAGYDVLAATLSRIGSGKPLGWVASLSRRISDCRVMAELEGATVIKSLDKIVVDEAGNRTRKTWYKWVKIVPGQCLPSTDADTDLNITAIHGTIN